ncbi:MAG: transglutaminase family protein [Rhodobacteraceae bacterium]|nr:transglutaminase family protein [Paracoccaceae bacterium]
MLLRISHVTKYNYDQPVDYGLQQVRLTPKSTRAQTVLQWSTTVDGGKRELGFEDHNRNTVELFSFEPGAQSLVVRAEGLVQLSNTHGVVGPHEGHTPLWLFQRDTPQTKAGKACRDLAKLATGETDLGLLHDLSARVLAAVRYETGATNSTSSAEEVLAAGKGVCQDHAHVFIACARHLGFPSRYVSGYLMMQDNEEQEATHAWAEVHVDALGWVGFDVPNEISPDEKYVRVATGLDYSEAAPVSGHLYGSTAENLTVSLTVSSQQQSQSQ